MTEQELRDLRDAGYVIDEDIFVHIAHINAQKHSYVLDQTENGCIRLSYCVEGRVATRIYPPPGKRT